MSNQRNPVSEAQMICCVPPGTGVDVTVYGVPKWEVMIKSYD